MGWDGGVGVWAGIHAGKGRDRVSRARKSLAVGRMMELDVRTRRVCMNKVSCGGEVNRASKYLWHKGEWA